MMKLLLVILMVVLILISIFLISNVTIYITYYHYQDLSKVSMRIAMWKGLITFHKEMLLPDEKYQPASFRENTYHRNPSPATERSASTDISMDDVQVAYQHVKEMLSEMRRYQPTIRNFTSKIKITNLQAEMHYGTGEASSTALATGALWSLTGGIIGMISRYFILLAPPKIDIIPYFSFRKSFETKIECIARLQMAKTILAGLKLARLLRR